MPDELQPQEPMVNSQLVASEDEIAQRRERVLVLRLRRMTMAAIAAICGVSEQTISLDLAWIRRNRRDRFYENKFDAAEFIGETEALYRECENQALLEHARLGDAMVTIGFNEKGEPIRRPANPVDVARVKMGCLREAMFARECQKNLFQDLGYLERKIGELRVTDLPRAAAIRRNIRMIKTEDRNLLSAAEQAFVEGETVE